MDLLRKSLCTFKNMFIYLILLLVHKYIKNTNTLKILKNIKKVRRAGAKPRKYTLYGVRT